MALIYLATYPRSGNSLLQRILSGNFWRLACQVKVTPRPAESLSAPKGWEIIPAPAPAPRPDWPESLIWNERTAVYRRGAEGEPWRRGLLDLTADDLTEDFRRALAAEAGAFFVKTHHLPLEHYFEGEKVIHVVRHPGPALWSYFRLMVQQALERAGRAKFDLPPPTLDRIIAGEVQFGSWAAYHDRWTAAGEELGGSFLKLDYARLNQDQAAARQALSAFLGLPVMSDAEVSFESYSSKRADQGLRGRDGGYERFYSRDQLERLWRAHGGAAERYGFAPPDLEHSGADDQLTRLEELVEMAWAAARTKTS